MQKNEGMLERSMQITIATTALAGGIFWISGFWQIIAVLFAATVGAFATVGFCPLYVLIGKTPSCSVHKLTRGNIVFLIFYAVALLTGESLISILLKQGF